MTKSQLKLRAMIIIALFAAIIGILAQITIPLPLIPITGQTLAIGLAATILGSKYGTLSVILYLMIGTIGVPVFSEFQGGLSTIVGPRGGYLVGFIPTAFIIGYYLEKFGFTLKHAIIANLIGMFVTLIFGTIWLHFAAQLSIKASIAAGMIPFLAVGVIKALLASWIGILVRERLVNANLLFTVKIN